MDKADRPAASAEVTTIFALSSGVLPAGLAVVRMSGPAALNVALALTGRSRLVARHMHFGTFTAGNGQVIDTGMTVFFPSPRSATGEDCVELHVHGSRAVLRRLLDELSAYPGLRPAAPGEFTRRALENGRIDVFEAEALADLIEAETEAERQFAIGHAGQRHRLLYSSWRERLLTVRALLEADIDFSDQDDLSSPVSLGVRPVLEDLLRELDGHRHAYRKAHILKSGLDVVIVGPPNAGKSSLLNTLADRDLAIVSTRSGTTRDLIEATLAFDGFKVRMTDTAGIQVTSDEIERMGMERASNRAAEADLVIYLDDGRGEDIGLDELEGARVIRVRSKVDLPGPPPVPGSLCISTVTGEGIGELIGIIVDRARDAAPRAGELIPWSARHKKQLSRAAIYLGSAISTDQAELVAEDLRGATASLSRLIGDLDVEQMLDAIFSRFCIGK